MSDLKVVLYKENRAPRTIRLSSRVVYRTLLLLGACSLLLVVSIGLAVRFYIMSRAKFSHTSNISSESGIIGPDNSIESQNRQLLDEIDALNAQLKNKARIDSMPKVIGHNSPVLGLFTPNIVDRIKDQNNVTVRNFKYTPGKAKEPTYFSFELHNAREGESVEKGYIVVLARTTKALKAYPDVFNKTGPYLMDFEKGETFQVARFRLVNAQFFLEEEPFSFQILLFTRNGELLVNTTHEVNASGNQ